MFDGNEVWQKIRNTVMFVYRLKVMFMFFHLRGWKQKHHHNCRCTNPLNAKFQKPRFNSDKPRVKEGPVQSNVNCMGVFYFFNLKTLVRYISGYGEAFLIYWQFSKCKTVGVNPTTGGNTRLLKCPLFLVGIWDSAGELSILKWGERLF